MPSKVAVLQRPEAWANQQILDEFNFSFPNTPVKVSPKLEGTEADLLVLPFRDDFLRELPGGVLFYQSLERQASSAWVMLYGLNYRRIELVPACGLYGYYRKRHGWSRLRMWLQRLRLLRLGRLAIRIYLWGYR